MKTASPREKPLRVLFLALAGIFTCIFSAVASQDSFDLDLKELRPAPARATGAAKGAFDIELKELGPAPVHRAPPLQRHRTAKPASAETAPLHSRESRYTVRPGDNLFLILIRQYGLSNSAAERLIPDVLQRNGIRENQILKIGQRLVIPLGAKARPSPEKSVTATLPSVPTATPVVQAPAAETPLVREIVLEAAAPCPLVRNLARELGLQIPSFTTLTHSENVSIGYDDLKMDVACGLTPAEAYTHERLLAPHGIQLLVFNGDVPPRQVVEELADRLGMTIRLADDTMLEGLPVTYLFPASDPAEKTVRLTIRPAHATQAP